MLLPELKSQTIHKCKIAKQLRRIYLKFLPNCMAWPSGKINFCQNIQFFKIQRGKPLYWHDIIVRDASKASSKAF